MNKEKEQQIAKRFENSVNVLIKQGYTVKDCTVPLEKGTFFMFLAALPFAAVIVVLYVVFADCFYLKLWEIGVFLGLLLVSVPLHEIIHAVFWAIACGGFKKIRLGFDKKTFTPYCAIEKPIKKLQYLLGSLAPFLILGILTGILSVVFCKCWLLALSVVNIFAAGGDIVISLKAIPIKKNALLLDHQQKAGFLAFYK